MNETLRPSTLGEILDRTVTLYRSRFLVFFGLAAIPAGMMMGFSGGMVLLLASTGFLSGPAATPKPETFALVFLGMMALGLIALPLLIASNALCGAALCQAASSVVLGGGQIAIASSLKSVWKRGWQYIGLFVLQAVIIFGVPSTLWTAAVMVAAVGAAIAGTAGGGGAATGVLTVVLVLLTMMALAVYVIWIMIQIGLAFPIAVIEKAGPIDALKRAWKLCRGTRWRMLALFAMVLALSWIASLLVTVPLMLAIYLIPGLNSPQNAQLAGTISLMGMYAMSFVSNALTMPVIAIALVLFYYDQRVRKEAYDIEWLMQQAGMIAAPSPQPQLAPWLPSTRSISADGAPPSPAPEALTPPPQVPEPQAKTEQQPEPEPHEPIAGASA
ncbi:procyclic acidic repetitive family protein [Occallatibacter riparius]|uniref:Procyclic acidic repetitive family protein n=1 Tax=Occallatibacter riparius TaxID=1002689 RepID=A0A9J7BNJ1_9BACT|nr:procyclic acidic repetitive family protein [Occallatibacter riparius]UWZ84291.1 procyclic acidic repetitive family protein [Occallatibacter riparius]